MLAQPLIYYGTPGKVKCKKAFAALSAGWRALGMPYERNMGGGFNPHGLQVFYGVTRFTYRAWRECQIAKSHFVYMDNDYFGLRNRWRVTKDATQHSGIGEPDFARFDALGLNVARWRNTGSYVLIVCQSKWWHERHGEGVSRWSQRVARECAKHTDRPIRIRMKPGEGPSEIYTRSFAQDMEDAWCVVTHSSAVANQAILSGIPAFVTSPCAALTMGSMDLSQIETPPRPDGRREWASVLAANQWTRGEIMTGLPWVSVMN